MKDHAEYMQYAVGIERVLSELEANLHESNDPQEIVLHALETACKFYGGDWAGFLNVDLELSLWMPYMWYNSKPEDKTTDFLQEFESSEFLYRWVRAMKENKPMIVSDCGEVKDAYPHEYEMYRRLGMRSVIAVSVKPFPTGFVVVRNPTRYITHSSMLQMLAFVVIKGVSEKELLDRAKMVWTPKNIKSSKDVVIKLFGEVEVYTDRGVLRESDLKSPKISRLLAYLTLHPKRTYSPRELAETIWPNEAMEQNNPGQNMKYLIHRLRQMFNMISDYWLVESTVNGYRLNPELSITTDLQQFEKCINAANCTSSVTQKIAFLEEALDLYKGDVLESAAGEHWLMSIATHYKLKYAAAGNELLKTLAELKDYSGVHHHAAKMLCADSSNVRAHFWLIYAAYQQGSADIARAALKEAEKCLTQDEYGELTAQLKEMQHKPYDLRPTRAIL